jgi:hypothetical protein
MRHRLSWRKRSAVTKATPGRVTVSLSVHEAADAFVRDPFTGKPGGYLLRDLQSRAEGGKITVTDPHRGEAHTLSIEHLSAFDPDRTCVVLHYRFTPDDPVEYSRRLREAAREEGG